MAERRIAQTADRPQWICPECRTANFLANQVCRHIGCGTARPTKGDRQIIAAGETPPRATAPPPRQSRARTPAANRAASTTVSAADFRALKQQVAQMRRPTSTDSRGRPPAKTPVQDEDEEEEEQDPWARQIKGVPKGLVSAVEQLGDASLKEKLRNVLEVVAAEAATPLIEARSAKAAAALRKAKKAFDGATRELQDAESEVKESFERFTTAQKDLAEKAEALVDAEDEVTAASTELKESVEAGIPKSEAQSDSPDETVTLMTKMKEKRADLHESLQTMSMPPERRKEISERLDELGDAAGAFERVFNEVTANIKEEASKEASYGDDPLRQQGHFSKAPGAPPAPTASLAAGSEQAPGPSPMEIAPDMESEDAFPALSAAIAASRRDFYAAARLGRNKQPKVQPKAPPAAFGIREEVEQARLTEAQKAAPGVHL